MEVKEINDNLCMLRSKEMTYNNQIITMSKEVEQYKLNIDCMQKEHEEMDTKIVTLKTQYDELSKFINSNIDKKDELMDINRKIKDQESILEKQTSKYNFNCIIINTFNTRINRLENKLENLNSEIDIKTNIFRTNTRLLTEQKTELDSIQKQVKSYKSTNEYNEMTTELEQLKSNITSCNQEHKRVTSELNETIERLDLVNDIESIREKHKSVTSELNETIERLDLVNDIESIREEHKHVSNESKIPSQVSFYTEKNEPDAEHWDKYNELLVYVGYNLCVKDKFMMLLGIYTYDRKDFLSHIKNMHVYFNGKTVPIVDVWDIRPLIHKLKSKAICSITVTVRSELERYQSWVDKL